ncbi:MAG: helix-turn-helix transcriptional regulator, partial [Slackia sp.]|nr:helix-turn-helix transcriptional regulator [Slackia sp.]
PMFANCIAAVILIVIIAVTHRRFEPTRIFLAIIPAIALLFIAFPFFFDTRPVLINVAMTVCYGMFDVILWYSVATAAYDFSTSGYVVGGVARSASIVSRLTGICIGYLVMKSMDAASSSMIVISAGALYLLAVIAVLYAIGRTGTFTLTFGKSGAGAAGRAIRVAYADDFLHDRKRSDEGAGDMAVSEGAEDPSMSVSAARCAACAFVSSERTEGIARQGAEPGAAMPTEEHASEPTGTVSENAGTLPAEEDLYGSFADDFGLTRREAEILPYLHRGRSARVIASSLYVAESTVRTHIRHILEKTGQHSKQELIDFMESHAQD